MAAKTVRLIKKAEKVHSAVYAPIGGTKENDMLVSSVYFLRNGMPHPMPAEVEMTVQWQDQTPTPTPTIKA